jgi:hypothetical protein
MLFLVNGNGVPSVAEWVRAAASTSLPGDFNLDGAVNAADYVVWRKGLGTTYTPADFVEWKLNFGDTAGAGGGASVPEPASALPCIAALIVFITGRCAQVRRSGCA